MSAADLPEFWPAKPERTKASEILIDIIVELLDGIVGGQKAVEHGTGGREDAGHEVKYLADLADVVQKKLEAFRLGTAKDAGGFLGSQPGAGGGENQFVVHDRIPFTKISRTARTGSPAWSPPPEWSRRGP